MLHITTQIPADAGADLASEVGTAIGQGWPVFLAMSGFVIGLAVFRRVRKG